MIQYEEITATAPLEPEYLSRIVILPRPKSPGEERVLELHCDRPYEWMNSYSVHKENKYEAQRLAIQLEEAYAEPNLNHDKIEGIIEKLKELRLKSTGEMTTLERWAHSAYQLADYCGGPNAYREIITRLNGYRGKILEAMCGHMTYFQEIPERNVISLDYCAVSLERCRYPQRRRICCDLNQVNGGTALPFFQKEEFDVVSICFGYRYPEYMEPLLVEFHRLLASGGRMSFIENPSHGYPELCKRKFDPGELQRLLVDVGFRNVTADIFMTSDSFSKSTYHHIQAAK